jgi:hypothetical protein
MLQIVPHKRDVYVPSSRAAAPAKDAATRRTPVLQLQTARLSTHRVFRGMAWDGKEAASEPVVIDSPWDAVDPRKPTRTIFATVAWSGETLLPPTDRQSENSLRSVLSGFNWE